jgi:hypothetical protein
MWMAGDPVFLIAPFLSFATLNGVFRGLKLTVTFGCTSVTTGRDTWGLVVCIPFFSDMHEPRPFPLGWGTFEIVEGNCRGMIDWPAEARVPLMS